MTPGFTTPESGHGRKQKRILSIPVSTWGISDTYSELPMSAILMNTPKIKFLEIRFLRIALKRQHSLAGTTQNRQETDLLIPKQRETWTMLNEMCCFWVNTSSKDRKASECSRKTFRSYRISKNDLESSWGGYNLSWGIFLLASRNLELVNAPTNPCYHHIDAACDYSRYCQLSNPFCLCPGQQATTYSASSTGYINLHLTMEGIIHP